MGLLVRIIFVLTTLECVLGCLVFAPKGTCQYQQAYGGIVLKKYECESFGGAWNGSPGHSDWIDCYTDMCEVPQSGAVSSKWAWLIDVDQTSTCTGVSRVYGIVHMQRKDCDQIRGGYNGNPSYNTWIGCHLYFKRVNGRDRRNIDGIIFSGINECSSKVAYGYVDMKQQDCSYIKGGWNGHNGANDWIDCHLDIVNSPVIDCIPSDSWVKVHTCSNDVNNSTFECLYELSTGIETETQVSETSDDHVEVTVTAEVSAELEGLFTASAPTSFTTCFHWENTVSNARMWSQATTKSFIMMVPPGHTYVINQVVGECNDYRIKSSQFQLTEANERIINE